MCGIAGCFNLTTQITPRQAAMKAMISAMYHRGPDEYGLFFDGPFAMGMSRLSIIDLSGGSQPISNEDETLWITFNGEIFNYVELQEQLRAAGHHFKTGSDTECIIHLYEEFGEDFVQHLNGQFAIAIWDTQKQELLLARDRVGIRPLYYGFTDGVFLFASEAKALFASDAISAAFDTEGLRHIFSYWVNLPGTTCYKNIKEVQPGHLLKVSPAGINERSYWSLPFPEDKHFHNVSTSELKQQLNDLLIDATRLRLRADVPVAAYLSGGLDSSIICALVKKYHVNDLLTFSVAFKDAGYDERSYQKMMADHLGTHHTMIEVDNNDIAEAFIKAVWFSEKPMIRTAPAPLLALSGLVRQNNIKVVLTGEGADEMFGGYNIFKEDKIRRFWARHPESQWRPLLLARLYPYVLGDNSRLNGFWQAFFKKNLEETDLPWYSHSLRWTNMQQMRLFISDGLKEQFNEKTAEDLAPFLPKNFKNWHPLNKAQFLEITLFMSGYLLSSQGDRMMMGNSVEGRFPFLDYRVMEWAAKLPPQLKINGLDEKHLLKKTFADIIPEAIAKRPKQPYRAPIRDVFLTPGTPEQICYVLDEQRLRSYGYFNPSAVKRLVQKLKKPGVPAAARDEMALTAIVSQQLLHYQMIENRQMHHFRLPEKCKLIDLNKKKIPS